MSAIAENTPEQPATVRKHLGMLSIRNALLLVAVIGVWTSSWLKSRDVVRLNARIAPLLGKARELVVRDTEKFALIERDSGWKNSHEWSIYVPDGRYELCIATNGIEEEGFLNEGVQTKPIAPGMHLVRLDRLSKNEKGWLVRVECDGQEAFHLQQPSEWFDEHEMKHDGNQRISEVFPVDQPLELLRRRYVKRGKNAKDPDIVSKRGILLWVRPVTKLGDQSKLK